LRAIGLVVLTVLLAVDAVLVAGLAFVVVSSLVGDAADDPHGYARIFGVVGLLALVPIGLVLLAVLIRVARPRVGE
jgi:hypothetical protein